MRHADPRSLLALGTILSLTACGGGGGDGASAPSAPPPSPTFSTGGMVTGLAGTGLVLQNNAGNDQTIAASGAFSFSTRLSTGAAYAVTVRTQPTSPAQTCAVTSGSGTIAATDITTVGVSCVTPPMTLMSVNPASDASGIARDVPSTLTFSVPLNAATAIPANITLQSAAGSASFTLGTAGAAVTLTPTRKLLPLTEYTLDVAAGLRGSFAEQMVGAVSSRFTTRDGQWAGVDLLESADGDAAAPRVAYDGSGNAFAVWSQDDGMRSNIWASRYSGGVWGAPVLLESGSGGANVPQITADAAGNAIAVWAQTGGSFNSIWSNRYTAGQGWGTAQLVEVADGEALAPDIAIDADGNALVVWRQTLSNGPSYSIWANRYTASVGWGTATILSSSGAGSADLPQAAFAPDGSALAVWQSLDTGSTQNIWAARYTAGVGWAAAAVIATDTGAIRAAPQVTFSANGTAMSVWYELKLSSNTGGNIMASRYTSDWSAPVAISGFPPSGNVYYHQEPRVAMDANGDAWVVWNTYVNGNLGHGDVWANRYAAGPGWGAAVELDTGSGTALLPEVVVDASGNALAVWQQLDQRMNIYARRYTPSAWRSPELIEINDAGGAAFPKIALDTTGDALVVWLQDDGTFNNIYSTRFE